MRIVVTAGPTREPIDDVRFLSNRSTGKLGYALAAALARRHEVTLVSGPTALVPPKRVAFVSVETAREMHAAVLGYLEQTDAVIMNAAVADYRPVRRRRGKIPKGPDLTLSLVRTVDILADLGRRKRPGQVLIGFALEARSGLSRARRKLAEKNLDAIVRNDLTTMGADTLSGTLIEADGTLTRLEDISKSALAGILEKVIRKVAGHDG